MLNGRSFSRVLEQVVRTANQMETISDLVLMSVMVQQGVPVAQVQPILAYLNKSQILVSAGTGQLKLGPNGYQVMKRIREWENQPGKAA